MRVGGVSAFHVAPRSSLLSHFSAFAPGGFKARGGAIGDVYISTCSRHHDRRIELPVFDEYGVWHHDSTPAERLVEALGFKRGIVSSGNSLNCSEHDRAALDAAGAHIKEMECAAIASVTHLFQVPFLAVKAITDIVDGDKTTGACVLGARVESNVLRAPDTAMLRLRLRCDLRLTRRRARSRRIHGEPERGGGGFAGGCAARAGVHRWQESRRALTQLFMNLHSTSERLSA